MKNVVFIPNVDLGDKRATPYHYSVKSWQKWCDKNDCELVEWTEPMMDTTTFPIIYQREWVFDILEHNEIDYDQVLIVDADTIVHPDCPNFFERTNHEYTAVVSNGCYEWVIRSVNAWGHFMFPDVEKPKVWEYFNTGFIIANKKHKPFFKAIQDFYLENAERLYRIRATEKYEGMAIPSTGQTCVNFLVKQHNIKVNYLPERFNLVDIFRKSLLQYSPTYISCGWHNSWTSDDVLLFKDAGYVFHFSSIPDAIPSNDYSGPIKDVSYWMEKTYKELHG